MNRHTISLLLAVLLPAIPGYAATVYTAGIPCSDAGTPCAGGPWVNGYIDPGPGVGNFISQTDAAPFNDFRGFDGEAEDEATDFSASWTFTYAPYSGGTTVLSASLLLALFDHDFAATGNQVSSFLVDGFDLTPELNTLLEASGGSNFEYNIYSLNLPGGVFLSLLDGSVTVSLTLQGPGLVQFIGFPDVFETAFNGAGIDYSTLTIDALDSEVVPEPSSAVLSLLGLVLIGSGWTRFRKSRRA